MSFPFHTTLNKGMVPEAAAANLLPRGHKAGMLKPFVFGAKKKDILNLYICTDSVKISAVLKR